MKIEVITVLFGLANLYVLCSAGGPGKIGGKNKLPVENDKKGGPSECCEEAKLVKIPVTFYYNCTDNKCYPYPCGYKAGNCNEYSCIEDCEENCVTVCPPCEQEPQAKKCKKGEKKVYYYDSASNKCMKFKKGFCGANDNAFETEEECKKCVEVPVCPCEQDPEKKPCNGAKNVYYYDRDTKTCKKFKKGYCGANENGFETEKECKEKCVEDICTLKKDEGEYCGDCKPEIRWYFNAKKECCEEFYYKGCEGNQNNFKCEKDCEEECPCKCKKPPFCPRKDCSDCHDKDECDEDCDCKKDEICCEYPCGNECIKQK